MPGKAGPCHLPGMDDRDLVTDFTEAELERFAIEGPAWRLLHTQLRLPATVPALHVRTDLLFPGRTRPGDIDILSAAPARPEAAVAIECKKVKVKADGLAAGAFTGLEKAVKSALGKAAPLADLGFSRAYVMFFVGIDARHQTEGNFAGRGLTPALVRYFDAMVRASAFPEALGVVAVEVVQPLDRSVWLSGGVGVRVRRDAATVRQGDAVTESVRRFLATRGR